jgi:murein DD-endopeptidase MepM/ murein hydrolase activator NlpD
VPPRPGLCAGIFTVAALALALAAPAFAGYAESPSDSFRDRQAEWILPLRGPFESPFGYRWGKLHAGVDVAVLGEDRVRAAAPGVVGAAGWLPSHEGYGLVVKLRHGGGVTTMYAHLARALVRVGEEVDAGRVIGLAGCTGSCTGQHLHFEVHERGKPVNPLPFLGKAARSLD